MSSNPQPNTFRAWLRRHYEVLLLGVILLAALALRLYGLERNSFWIDELTQIRRSRLPFFAMLRDVIREISAVPIEYAVTHFVYYYVGRSEGILRLPAVLWGTSSAAVVYFLGRRMFDRTTGFLAAALLAFMPIQIYYSQEMRPYILASFMVLLTTFAFHRAVSLNTRWAWALYAVTLTIGMYAHYYVAVVGILHGAWLLLMCLAKRRPWRSLRPYLIAAGIAGLLFAPWVAMDIRDMIVRKGVFLNEGRDFRLPTLETLLRAPFVSHGANYALTVDRPLTWFVGAAWTLAAAGVAFAITGRARRPNDLALIAVVSLAGMASAVAMDAIGSYYFAVRQIVPFAPVLVLLVCAAWTALFRAAWKRLLRRPTDWIAGTLAAVVLLGFSVGTLQNSLASTYKYGKQDWRGVSRYLLQHAEPEDAVLLRVTFDVEHYAPELAKQIQQLRSMKTVREAAAIHPRVWIVDWSGALDRYVPDVGEWLKLEKPLRIRGFVAMELYLYSDGIGRQELQDSLKR